MRPNRGQPAGGHHPAAGWVNPAGHHARAAPHYTCSSFALCRGEFFFPGQESMKCSLHHGFPFQLFTFALLFVPFHSRIPPSSSVLIFCPSRACPLFPPQTPLTVRCCCCLHKILVSLPYPLPSPRALPPARRGREAGEGEEGRLCLPRAAGRGESPPASKSTRNLGDTKQCQCPSAADGFGKDPSRTSSDGKYVL